MFEIKIKTGNAAFRDIDGDEDVVCELDEVIRILEDIIKRIKCCHTSGKCIDINGNAVGNWRLS